MKDRIHPVGRIVFRKNGFEILKWLVYHSRTHFDGHLLPQMVHFHFPEIQATPDTRYLNGTFARKHPTYLEERSKVRAEEEPGKGLFEQGK